MIAVTIWVTLEPKKINPLLPLFPLLFVMKWWNWMPDLNFWMLSFKPSFSLSSFILIKRLFQFNSVMFDSLLSHGLQHTKPPCPSPTPGVYSNSRPLSLWCHPTISCSVIPFSSRLQSFSESGSFQMSQVFASGDQSIGVSASASLLPWIFQDWFPLR